MLFRSRLISSGSMVIVVPENKKKEMLAAMENAEVEATYVGVIRELGDKVVTICGGIESEVDPPYSDELYKVIGKK